MVEPPSRRVRGARVAAMLVAALLLAPMAPVFGEEGEEPALTASSGVFTAEQAERGREAFAHHCAHCHGSELEGGFGPRLAPLDPAQFRDAPLSRPYQIMRTEMPFDAPGSLEDQVYAAILAFVLHENGYPSGSEPLAADAETLSNIVLDEPPAE